MKIRLTAGAVVLSLGLGLGVILSTPASAHTLTKGKPYGCQINNKACATVGPQQGTPSIPPQQLPQTGGAVHGGGISGDTVLPIAGVALALAGFGLRRVTRR